MKFKFFQEFKEFAIKGNMVDIAVGVIVGTAFNKLIDAIVKEAFMPPLSYLTDGVNYANKKWVLRPAVDDTVAPIEEIAIGYGKLIEAGVDFLIIAMTVFIVVKIMNALKTKSQDPQDKTVNTPKDIELLSNMNDLMERQVLLLEGMKFSKKAP